VVAGGVNAPSGKVEEITLSYIVVRLADERRLIVPSTYFTSNTFENWTRRAAKQLGSVELKLDWAAPMTLIRNQVQKLLLATDLWDGRSWAVQVADSDATTITVRIVVSAKDSGTLWDLRCYLRENMIRWIAEQEPAVRPLTRIQPLDIQSIQHDTSREAIARLAKELSGIAVDTTGAPDAHTAHSPDSPVSASPAASIGEEEDAVHEVRLLAARQKAKRARRRAMAQRQRELADTGSVRSVAPSPAEEQTQVFTQTMLHSLVAEQLAQKVAQANARLGNLHPAPQETAVLPAASAPSQAQETGAHPEETVIRGERLFSGSPEADERNEIYAGPGEDVLAEREAAAKRHQEEAARKDAGPRIPQDATRPLPEPRSERN